MSRVIYQSYPAPLEYLALDKVTYFFYRDKADADACSRAAYQNLMAEQKAGVNYNYKPYEVGAITRLPVIEGAPRSGYYCVTTI